MFLRLILGLSLLIGEALGQSAGVSIPLRSFRAIAHPIKAAQNITFRGALKASVVALEISNGIDAGTTEVGVIHGPYCEQSTLFKAGSCGIYSNRFIGWKFGIAALPVAEWIPIWTHHENVFWDTTAISINAGLTMVFTKADANNLSVLTTGKK